MKMTSTTRLLAARCITAAATGLLCLAHAKAQPPEAQPGAGQYRPQVQQRMAAPPSGGGAQMGPREPNAERGAHLGQWMEQHRGMNPQQQQRALRNEPGFNQLPGPMQQRMMQRLDRLNSMPPQQRERMLRQGEAMERMSPQQRGDVRNAMGQLSLLPLERRRAVARSFRELRSMPVPERNALLNSPQFRQQFTDEERGTLGNLLAVGPLLPPSR
jgi:hypothetical protein